MNLRFVDHALERMTERGIGEAEVRRAIERSIGHPVPGNRPDTIVIRGYAGARVLKVVLNAVDRELVVSAYWEGRS